MYDFIKVIPVLSTDFKIGDRVCETCAFALLLNTP